MGPPVDRADVSDFPPAGFEPEPTAPPHAREIGPGRHYVFLARIDDPSARDRLGAVRDCLDAFDCLAVTPDHHLHVTTKVVGTAGPGSDRLDPDRADRIAERARDALAGARPFEVTVPRLGLFPTVVYGTVDDGGGFERLNRRLRDVEGMPVHGRDAGGDPGFVPHATLAWFVNRDVDDLLARLGEHRVVDAGPWTVDRVELIVVPEGSLFGRFETVASYPLE